MRLAQLGTRLLCIFEGFFTGYQNNLLNSIKIPQSHVATLLLVSSCAHASPHHLNELATSQNQVLKLVNFPQKSVKYKINLCLCLRLWLMLRFKGLVPSMCHWLRSSERLSVLAGKWGRVKKDELLSNVKQSKRCNHQGHLSVTQSHRCERTQYVKQIGSNVQYYLCVSVTTSTRTFGYNYRSYCCETISWS